MRMLRSTPRCSIRWLPPWIGSLPFRQWPWVLAVFATAGAAAHAQHHGHVDVEFQYVDARVQLNRSVYTHIFPQSGISRQYTTNPGFASESDVGGGVGPHDTIFYDVLDPLFFWNGSDFAQPAAQTQIRIENNPPSVPDTIVSRQTGAQDGSLDPPRNRIGSALPSGDFHSHVSFQLEPYQAASPPPPPEFGAYGIKLSVATSAEGIEPSDPVFLVFNFGLDEATFEEGVDAFDRLLEGHGVLGDYNLNGELDAGDLDLQALQIVADGDPTYDLNEDGVVDFGDRLIWVHDLKGTWIGDANLNGVFNSGDMVQVFAQGKYETGQTAGWEVGDWNGDTFFTSSDMVAAFADGGYEKGLKLDAVAVPEPASAILILGSLAVMATRRRRFVP